MGLFGDIVEVAQSGRSILRLKFFHTKYFRCHIVYNGMEYGRPFFHSFILFVGYMSHGTRGFPNLVPQFE